MDNRQLELELIRLKSRMNSLEMLDVEVPESLTRLRPLHPIVVCDELVRLRQEVINLKRGLNIMEDFVLQMFIIPMAEKAESLQNQQIEEPKS